MTSNTTALLDRIDGLITLVTMKRASPDDLTELQSLSAALKAGAPSPFQAADREPATRSKRVVVKKEPRKFTRDWLEKTHKRLKAKPATDEVIFDAAMPRFGVRLKGRSISFLVQYRQQLKGGGQSPSRRYGIGKYPLWDLDKARERARHLLTEADSGRDPLQARIEAEKAPTMRQLVAEYRAKLEAGKPVREDGKLHKATTVRSEKWRLDHIAAHFADRKARELTKRDIIGFRDRLLAEKKGAARTLGTLSALMSYGSRYHDDIAPGLLGVKAPADRQREVHLTADQYALLGEAIREAEAAGDIMWQVGAAIRLIALTGCRRGEVLQLKWTEIDLEGGALRLADSKTGRSVRALPDVAVRLLRDIRETYSKNSVYVLPGKPGKGSYFKSLTLPWTRILPLDLRKLQPDNEPLSPHGFGTVTPAWPMTWASAN